MDLSKISLEVDEVIRKLVSRYNNMYNPSGQIAQIELDLLLEEIRLFYTKVKELSDANLQHFMKEKLIVSQGRNVAAQPIKEASPVRTSPAPEKHIPLYEAEELTPETIPVDDVPVNEIPPMPVRKEPEPEPPVHFEAKEPIRKEEKMNDTIQETVEANVAEEQKKPVKAENTGTLASKFHSTSPLAEKLGQPGSDYNSSQHKVLHKVTNLKNAISFGDRFLFISELFGGNDGAFDYTIAQLNECGDRSEAVELFNSIRDRKKWNADTEAVTRLFDLVDRRYQ